MHGVGIKSTLEKKVSHLSSSTWLRVSSEDEESWPFVVSISNKIKSGIFCCDLLLEVEGMMIWLELSSFLSMQDTK